MESHPLSFSIIIPCLNERASLPSLLKSLMEELNQLCRDFEIIVVDDGSSDGTSEFVLDFKRNSPFSEKIQLVTHTQNLGLAQAFLSGLKKVGKQYWTWLPGDGEISASQLCCMIRKFKEVETKAPGTLVISNPIGGFSSRSIFRRVLSRSYQAILRFIFKMDISYFNGPVIYPSRDPASIRILSRGFSTTAEVLIRALNGGEPFLEVPIELQARQGGVSKAISLRSLWSLLRDWARIWWDLKSNG